MAACPVSIVPSVNLRRRPLVLTQRRLEANRRNAARSTGPRTAAGKSRVARNAIKHGFFVGQERWSPQQHRDFAYTLDGLRDEFKPHGILEEGCVATIAESYVRMAAMFRYENIAAFKYHQHCDRELNEVIAAADEVEAARLEAHREKLRRAGLWRPTIPGPREARAIIRYSVSLDRAIREAFAALEGLRTTRIGAASPKSKVQKQTHFERSSSNTPAPAEGPPSARSALQKTQKQTHFIAAPSTDESAKTNPLSSMFMGNNRHERRRAKALARRRGEQAHVAKQKARPAMQAAPCSSYCVMRARPALPRSRPYRPAGWRRNDGRRGTSASPRHR